LDIYYYFSFEFLYVYKTIYAILVVEKWQSDTSRLLITMGIHQKEQLRYLDNIQTIVNSTNAIGNVDIIHKEKTKEEEIIYRQFPITCLEHFNELDDELKQIKLSKVDVYDALVSFKFM